MRAVVVYESMFGNTHAIAEAVARGLRPGNDVTVVPVARVSREVLAGADLVVAGGPTHVHGMSRAKTREAAVAQAGKARGSLSLDPDAAADGPGMREWSGSLAGVSAKAAVFDTRQKGPALFTGQASKAIARSLRRQGLDVIGQASFLVTSGNKLVAGEGDRAQRWGQALAAQAAVAGRA
jgi:flavodoxin-like protein